MKGRRIFDSNKKGVRPGMAKRKYTKKGKNI